MCPKNPANFNVDNVRVAKLLGGGLHNSTIVRGMVLKSDAVGSIKRIEKAKVSYYKHIQEVLFLVDSYNLSILVFTISLSYSGLVVVILSGYSSEIQIFTFTLPSMLFPPVCKIYFSVLLQGLLWISFPHNSFLGG